jgi:nicotinamidase-related amidase
MGKLEFWKVVNQPVVGQKLDGCDAHWPIDACRHVRTRQHHCRDLVVDLLRLSDEYSSRFGELVPCVGARKEARTDCFFCGANASAHSGDVYFERASRHAHAPVAEGTEDVKLHPAVADRSYDYLVTKTLPSVFSEAHFDKWLKEKSIDTLTVVGYMTHNCNDSTIREAMHRGYHVETLNDATGSPPYKNSAGTASAEDIHRITLIVMESAYAAVMSTDAWIASLALASRTTADNIFFSNQGPWGICKRSEIADNHAAFCSVRSKLISQER